jgi:hypothetical protein
MTKQIEELTHVPTPKRTGRPTKYKRHQHCDCHEGEMGARRLRPSPAEAAVSLRPSLGVWAHDCSPEPLKLPEDRR